MMARFKRGRPIMQPYTPSTQVNAGDVIVIGSYPCIAHIGDPLTTLQGSPVVTYSVDSLSIGGGVYQCAADALYPNGTYVYWNSTNSQVTASGLGGGVPFGVIVGGPNGQLSDGGPTGAASLCDVYHNPDGASNVLSSGAVANDIATNSSALQVFQTTATIPAGTLNVGDTISIKATGAVTGVTANATNDILLRILTALNTNTNLVNTGAINAANGTGFQLTGDVVFTTVGNSGTFNFTGTYAFAGTLQTVAAPIINAAINTNLPIVITVADTQNAASASNTTQLVELVVQKTRR